MLLFPVIGLHELHCCVGLQVVVAQPQSRYGPVQLRPGSMTSNVNQSMGETERERERERGGGGGGREKEIEGEGEGGRE